MLVPSLLAAAVIAGDTSTEYLDRYREIMALAPMRESVAEVNQLVLRRDAAEITLAKGTLYLLSPVGGRTVGAIFRGAGRFSLVPPHAAERESLRRALDVESVDDSITEIILLFSDSTLAQLHSLTFHPAARELPGDLRGHVHDLVESLQGEKEGSFDGDVLGSLLNDEPTGFFLAHVRRVNGPQLLFEFDPTIVEATELYRPASERHWGANWRVITQFAPAQPLSGEVTWHFRQRLGVEHYGLEVWLTPTGTADLNYAAAARMTLRAEEPVGPWLRFELQRKLKVDSARWGDGAPAATFKAEEDDELWVRSPHRLAPGDSALLQLFYHGNLIDRFENWFFIDPTAAWYPRNRQGDDAATFDITYHSPNWYPIASVGQRTDSTVAGKVMTTRWVVREPTPNATFNLGLFDTYHRQFEGAPALDVMISDQAHRLLRQAGMPEQRNMRENVATDVSNSLKWFTFAFGVPLWDHFYVTEIPYYEGVSFPGMIDLSWETFQNTALDGFDEFFRAHEVAHQWWGNGVRPATYRDAWLSEGIASFSGLWYLQAVRKSNKEYFHFLEEYSRNIKNNRNNGATWLGYRNLSPSAPYAYQAYVYEKGAWVMHMLRIMMLDLNTKKDDRFSAMMRDFHDTFKGKSATTDDFRRLLEGHLGGASMNWFFDQWVKGSAIPTYHVAWTDEATPDGRHRVRLRVTQEDVPPEFQAWVLVSADLGENRFANFRIKVSGAQADYASPVLPVAARAVTFNELHSVLADVKMERW
ncbi:MAG TPA: M1 family aminopeptidase [Gemmatimonadales bacterium]|nr:M1 family aminopeptidase [Gemmatimonadales bacterium]